MKKKMALALVTALAMGMMSGAAVQAEERIELEFWHRASAGMGLEIVEKYTEEFNNSQDKYTIKAVYNSGEYQGIVQSLVAEAATGNTPAIVQLAWTWCDYLEANFPVTSIADLEGGSDYLTQFDSNLIDVATSNGTVVGVPFAMSCPFFYYNTELCEQAGLDINNLPTTWEEVAEWAKTISENTDAEGFSVAAPPDFWLEEYTIESFGGSIYDVAEDGSYVAKFDSQEAVDALNFVKGMYEDGSGVFLSGADAIKDAFTSGSLGIMVGTCGWSSGFVDSCSFDFVTGSVVTDGVHEQTAPVGGAMLAITATKEEEIEGAWEFLQFLTADDAVEEWCEATGYLPGKAAVRENEKYQAYVAEHSYLNAGLNIVDKLNTPVSFPGESALELQSSFIDMRDAIYTGQSDAAEATKVLAEQANELMNE